MNSSMMPQDGFYTKKTISPVEFKGIFLAADEIVSSVAYQEIQDVVGYQLGLTIPIDRAKGLTVLDPISTILCVKLSYRVPAERKGHRLGSRYKDYEFSLIQFEAL